MILDLFAGAGGWDEGCALLDLETHRVEINPQARATAHAAGHHTLPSRNVWTEVKGDYDGIVASPPCQPFSVATKYDSAADMRVVNLALHQRSYRNISNLLRVSRECKHPSTALVLLPLHHVIAHRVEWTAWEQVPAILPLWQTCSAALSREGYHGWTGIVSCETFGVPQVRKRSILIASRTHKVKAPIRTHSHYYSRTPHRLDPDVEQWITMADALGWGLSASPAPTVTGGGGATGGPDPITHLDRYVDRPDWVYQRPSPTIVSTWDPGTVAGPGYRTDTSRQHAVGSTRLSVAEAGVIQSFRRDYPWRGNRQQQYLQVGNAVPPLLAKAVVSAATGQ